MGRIPADLDDLSGTSGAAGLLAPPPPLAAVVRFGTWNIHEGIPQVAGSPGDLVRLARRHRVDVLALQEVPMDRDGRSAVLDRLADEAGLSHSCALALSDAWLTPNPQLSGVAVASRFPISSFATTILPNPGLVNGKLRSFDKGMITASISVGGRDVLAASVHMLPFHRFQRGAEEFAFGHVWRELARNLGPAGAVTIVGGDFNTARRDLLLDRVGWQLKRAIGDRPTHNGLAVDDVLYSKGAFLRATSLVANPFDHALCVAELALE